MKSVFLIALSCFTAITFGQSNKFSFKLGSEYEIPRKSEDLGFYGTQATGIVNLFLKDDLLTILSFNPKTLNQTREKQIEMDLSRLSLLNRSRWYNS